MRSLIGFVVLVAALVGVGLFVVAPIVVPMVVASVIRDSPLIHGQRVVIDVQVYPEDLIQGRIDRVHVSGSSILLGTTSVERLDVTAENVGVIDRSFTSLRGQLTGVRIVAPDGVTATLASVDLAGRSSALTAVATWSAGEVTRLARDDLRAVGIPADSVTLGAGSVSVLVAGLQVTAGLSVQGGSLILGAGRGLPAVSVFTPGPDDPWRLTSAVVSPSGVTLAAAVNPVSLLGRAGALL